MMTIEQYDTRNIAELVIDGEITKEQFDAVVEKLDGMIHEFGKIRIVEVIKGIDNVEPAAMWADLKWEPHHITSFSAVAVVADQKWIQWMVKPLAMLIPADVRVFHLDEVEEARDWIVNHPAF